MKYTLLVLTVWMMNSFSLLAQEEFDGIWSGKISEGSIELVIDLEIDVKKNKLLLFIPAQKISELGVSKLEIEGDSLLFEIASFRVKYRGKYDQSKNEITGNWNQNGNETKISFKKVSKLTQLLRPQTPKEPYPYFTEDIIFRNDSAEINLAGTFTRPIDPGNYPVVILVSGSGAQNRNSEILGHKPFLVIADYFAKNGIATLRYDDRGFEESEGKYFLANSLDFADDVDAAIDYIKTRNDVDLDKIGIVGHSEGGLIAPVVASRRDDLGFIISLAGPGQPIAELMTDQNRLVLEKAGMSNEGLDIVNKELPKIYEIVNIPGRMGLKYDTLIPIVHSFYDALPKEDQTLLAPSKESYYTALASAFHSTWFRYFISHDPEPYWSKVKIPVLSLNGEEDIQIPADSNLKAIKTILDENGNENHKEVSFTGLNHLFQKCNSCSLSEYASLEMTFSEDVLVEMKEWILHLN